MRAAVGRHLLEATGGATYSFVHPVFRDLLEEELLDADRRRLHAATARALASRTDERADAFETVGAVARHWTVARAPGPAFDAAVRAGLAAAGLCAFVEADRYLSQALDLLVHPEVADRPHRVDVHQLLMHAADVAHAVGDDARAIELADRATDGTDEPGRRSEVLERRGTYCFNAGRPEEGEAAFRAALELLPAGPSVARARVLSGIGLLATGWSRFELAVDTCTEAIAVARAVGARTEEGRALNALGVATALLGDLSTGIGHSRQAVVVAESTQDPDALSVAYLNLTHLLSLAGACDEALDVLDHGYVALGRVGLLRQEGGFLQANVAVGLEAAGRWAEAEALLEAALEHPPRGLPGFPIRVHAARLRLHQGDLPASEQLLGRAREVLSEHTPPDSWRRELLEVEAELQLWSGHPDRAWEVAQEGLALVEGGDEERCAGTLAWLAARALADLADVPTAPAPARGARRRPGRRWIPGRPWRGCGPGSGR